jgi:Cu/Ag efflux protein CusF
MRRFLAVLAFAAVLMGAGAAVWAKTIPHPGVVKSVDPATGIVELEDGMRFRAGDGVEVKGLRPGSRVIFNYYDTGETKTLGSYEYVTN